MAFTLSDLAGKSGNTDLIYVSEILQLIEIRWIF